MALSPLFLSPSSPPLLARRGRTPVMAAGTPSLREERVVIIGAGIAGLATAVSLHRLGVRSVVLEQGESLRTGGTSLTLFKNGWRVLDAIGVGDELREQFTEIEGMAIRSRSGRELRSFSFHEEAPGQEVRAVERRVLLESLAGKLPSGTISYSSGLKNIQRQVSDKVLLELDNGQKLMAKTVIGCDGIRSPVARWMGFSDPHYVGHSAFRGLGIYPEGQPFKPVVNYIYGRGLRAGYVPVSSTKVYWFICFNSASPGPPNRDPSSLKNEAQELVKYWPSELVDVIDRTADGSVIKTPLVDRWLWPFISPPASSRGVVVVGDAWHPMTPNLGQGACCALEDAVVLSRNLAAALDSNNPGHIDEALTAYGRERWNRVFPLTVRANLVGSLLQWEDRAVCAVRDNIMIPKVVRIGPLLEHTNYECELPDPVTETT